MVDLSIGNDTYQVTVDETTFNISVGSYAISGGLNNLSDVDVSAASTGEVLTKQADGSWQGSSAGSGNMNTAVYDVAANGVVDNAEALGGSTLAQVLAAGGGASQLTDLSDVNTATVTNRFVLVADGVDFESRALVEADISDFGSYASASHTHTVSDITDFPTIPTVSDVAYNATTWDTNTDAPTKNAVRDKFVTVDSDIAGKADSSHTHTASEVTDFDTEVSNNSSVTANTAKVTNATHTGDATGDSALTVVGLRGVSLDSTVGSPSDGDILVYRSAGTDWVLETKPAGGSNPALADITDVTLTTVGSDELLFTQDGTNWINQTLSEAGIAAASHTHTASEITDFDTEVSNNSSVTANTAKISYTDAAAVSANTAKVSADGSIATHSDVTLTALGVDELLFTQDGSTWINQTLSEAGIQAVPSEGAFVDGDKTKLDGIEIGADVTDVTNVTAAGALMDSEVTNLAQVKAFDSSDYATAAQGATADSAVQPASVDTLTNKTINANNNTITNLEIGSEVSASLTADLDYNSNGIKITGQTVGGSNGDLVYLSGSNTWSQADADAEATTAGAMGLRISATDVLLRGVYTTTGLTAGSTYYASTTAGGITTIAPSASGDIVRIVGYALTTTEFFFNPDGSYVELS